MLNFHKIIFSKVTAGQIFWFNSSSAMLLECINWTKNLKWCLIQNVSPVAILVSSFPIYCLHKIKRRRKNVRQIDTQVKLYISRSVHQASSSSLLSASGQPIKERQFPTFGSPAQLVVGIWPNCWG